MKHLEMNTLKSSPDRFGTAALMAAIFLGAAPLTTQADVLALWQLDEPVSTTGTGTVLDSALGLHPGTPDAGTTFGGSGATAATGSSANFATSRISVPYATDLNPNQYTVSAWARTPSTGGIATVISSRSGDGAGSYIIYKISGRWEFWTGNNTGGWTTTQGPAVVPDEWTHLAATYDGTTMKFFVNGVMADSKTPAGYGRNASQQTFIGRGGNSGTEFPFDGDIDDVAIFDRPLDSPLINQVMSNGAASLPTPSLLSLGKAYAYGGNLPKYEGVGGYYFDDPHPQSLGTYGTGDLTDGSIISGPPTASTISTIIGFDPVSDVAEIIFDLEDVYKVSQIRIGTHTWSPFANGAPDDVTVSFSTTNDAPGSFGSSVFEVFTVPGANGHHDLIVPVDYTSARYVKLAFDGGAVLSGAVPNKYMLDEVSVYGFVPEPSSAVLLFGGAVLLLAARRKK